MIRSGLLAAISRENPGLTVKEVECFLDHFFGEIGRHLVGGGRVEFRGFGSFSTAERRPNVGRNPTTGEVVAVPGRRVVRFRPGKTVRDLINPPEGIDQTVRKSSSALGL